MIGSHIMQQLIDHRNTGAPARNFAPLDKELWIRIIDIYEEEVALQYPFLDLEVMRQRIRASTPHPDNSTAAPDQAATEDIMSLVLSVASSIVDPGTLTVANTFVEGLFSAAMLRTQLGAVNKTDLSIIILAVCTNIQICQTENANMYAEHILLPQRQGNAGLESHRQCAPLTTRNYCPEFRRFSSPGNTRPAQGRGRKVLLVRVYAGSTMGFWHRPAILGSRLRHPSTTTVQRKPCHAFPGRHAN